MSGTPLVLPSPWCQPPKSPTSGRESLAPWWLWQGSARPTARSAKHHIHASAPAFQRVPNLM